MEFSELVLKRYSCRKYKSIPVEREKIIRCIESARVSPSACNSQPWQFVIVDEPQLKQKVAQAATAGIYKSSGFIAGAAAVIVVLADRGGFLSRVGSLIRNTRFYLIDIGIICEHIVLQAAEMGIGTCYVGWFNEKSVKKVLNIPGKFEIPVIIAMGYPDDSYKPKDPVRKYACAEIRKNINDISSFNGLKQTG